MSMIKVWRSNIGWLFLQPQLKLKCIYIDCIIISFFFFVFCSVPAKIRSNCLPLGFQASKKTISKFQHAASIYTKSKTQKKKPTNQLRKEKPHTGKKWINTNGTNEERKKKEKSKRVKSKQPKMFHSYMAPLLSTEIFFKTHTHWPFFSFLDKAKTHWNTIK